MMLCVTLPVKLRKSFSCLDPYTSIPTESSWGNETCQSCTFCASTTSVSNVFLSNIYPVLRSVLSFSVIQRYRAIAPLD